MIIEEPRKNATGKILTIMVLCSTLEEATNYKIPLKYSWGYDLVDGVLKSFPYNRKYPYYRILQKKVQKNLISLK